MYSCVLVKNRLEVLAVGVFIKGEARVQSTSTIIDAGGLDQDLPKRFDQVAFQPEN